MLVNVGWLVILASNQQAVQYTALRLVGLRARLEFCTSQGRSDFFCFEGVT